MLATSNIPKRHHYVPQFILRNFTDKSEKLHCFNRKTSKTYRSSPADVFLEKYLYTHRSEDGATTTDLETKLSEIEGDVAHIVEKIIKRVRRGDSIALTKHQCHIWMKFIVYQLGRHPDSLSRLLQKDSIPGHINDYERKYGRVPEDVKVQCLTPESKERLTRNSWIESNLNYPDRLYTELAPLFNGRRIAALVAKNKSKSFVIGDTGVIRYPKARHELWHPNTRLLYPISWDVVLAWGFPRNSKDVISIPYYEVCIANELIFNQSDIIAGCAKELIESLSRKTERE
ncbi:MAG: DUF4238 domain-containing protein [Bacteroidetes bacterium]|nr:DUF4238 domain-containing protein [Bacteroidota bacterium]